jgi:hypothetical protein
MKYSSTVDVRFCYLFSEHIGVDIIAVSNITTHVSVL